MFLFSCVSEKEKLPQNERGVANVTKDSLRDCSLELIEAKDQINLLQNYIKEIRTPHSEKDLILKLNQRKCKIR